LSLAIINHPFAFFAKTRPGAAPFRQRMVEQVLRKNQSFEAE
jgi:hypothetical protein